MDQYQLSNLPQRFLSTQHYHSSLDEPNINNIEAKLYAIRQRNYQMAQNFFQQKYGQSSAYDQYLQENNMKDLKPINRYQGQEEMDLKKLLRHKKQQIQRNQMEKIKQNKNYMINNNIEAIDIHNQINNRKMSKNNPWNDKNKITSNKNITNSNNSRQSKIINNPYDQNQNDYLDISNQMIDLKQYKQQGKKGQFMNQFKQYLANKNKMKQKSNSPKDSPHKNINNTSLTKSKMMKTFESNVNNANNMTNNKSNISQNKNVSQLLQKSISPQQQLVKKIFKNILKQPSSPSNKSSNISSTSYIQKIELAQYLTQNQRILKILNIQPSQLIQKIQSQLQKKDPNKVYYHQCLMFFYKLLGKQNQHKKLKAEHSFLELPQGCILEPEVIKIFQKVFKQLDKHYDLIVKRLDYVEKLVNDQNLQKIINTPAVYEKHLEKAVSLRRIFERIQVQSLLAQNQKAFQYISWAQFMKYFQSGHTDNRKYDILRLVQSLKDQENMGFVDIPENTFQVIIKSVKKLDKGQEYFNTYDLIAEILIDKIYQQEKYSFVRGKVGDNKSGNIPMETFEEVLKRIRQTAPKFITVKQFLEFFSVKGQPIELVQKKINQEIKKNNDAVKVTKFQDQYFQQNNQVDGYDSDPEFYNQSQVLGKKDFRKTMGNNFKQSSPIKKGSELRQNDFHSNQKNSNNVFKDHYKVTVPKPFNFQIRQQERAKQKMNRSLSFSDNRPKSEYKFKAKQIPSKVKQVGLLHQIMQQNQKKIQDRRKCSMLLTLANQQPFSFYNRKTNKKTKQQRQQYQFKANPIPWYCSVSLLAKKQQQQINRNQKIARRAQQSLNKAKFPPRMQKDHQEKIARKNMQSNKKQIKTEHIIRAKQPPNFQLLHKQFQSAMERKRKENKTTEVKQFNFKQVKREKKVDNDLQRQQLSMINQNHQNKQQKWRQTLKSSINVIASSTAKFDQQVQKRRKQIQQKKRKEQQKLKQQQQRRKVDQQLKQKLKSQTFKAQQKKLSQINQSKKQQMKRQQQNFKQMKAEWIKNAKKQPLLIERPLKRDQRLEKMKRLGQISQNLKKNGIKGKQHDGYFNRQQLLMLQDYQMLKKAERI